MNELQVSMCTHVQEHLHVRIHTQPAGKDGNSSSLSNGLEAVKVWQEKFQEVESRYKESMVSNAQLYNEKTALVYQVEVLKDRCVCVWVCVQICI